MNEVYEPLNKSWKSTCRILFGEEIGELAEFEDYLKGAAIGQQATSCFSGNKMWVASDQYSKDSRFFDYGKELDEFSKISSAPVDIDKIKDIDSLLEAVKEKLVYGGNKAFGNSRNIMQSDAIVDCTNILNSSRIIRSRNVAYSYLMRGNLDTFGSTSSSESSQIIRCYYNCQLKRCFECCTSITSDSYFVYNVINCSDCMFTFNVRAKKYLIGNVQLDKAQYDQLKKKLVEEMKNELKSKKRLGFSIIDIVDE